MGSLTYFDATLDPFSSQLGHAQDPLANFDEEYPELANRIISDAEAKKKKKKSEVSKPKGGKHNEEARKKTNKLLTSYVKTKSDRKGHRLIKIRVYDLNENPEVCDSDGDGAIISSQYVVVEPYDDIMDHTNSLVNKISKKLCGNCV